MGLGGGGASIYIYIYIFRCFGNLDFVLEGEEFDYKGRIEICSTLLNS